MVFSINDFTEGDKVYHLSDSSTIMVVNSVDKSLNEVNCEWMASGQLQEKTFKPASLGKVVDPGPLWRTVTNLP